MIQWLTLNWLKIAVPALVIIACFAIGLWLRRTADSAFERWLVKTEWEGSRAAAITVRRPFLFWFLLIGISIAIQVSILPPGAKSVMEKTAASLFILSLGWVSITLSEQLMELYLPKVKAPQPTIALAINTARIIVILISALVTLEIWGAPTTPLLLFIAAVILAAMLALRNVAPDIFAWFQLEADRHIRVGDYIKLETGEEGYVFEINWNNTRIKSLDGSTIIIPNSRLLQHAITNYGDPLKKGREIFQFSTQSQTARSTGNEAADRELAGIPNAEKPHSIRVPETRANLSEREKEISRLIAEGISNKEVAEKLFIAENTVKVHVKNILKKLELRNRQQLAAYTVLQNWAAAGEGKPQDKQP